MGDESVANSANSVINFKLDVSRLRLIGFCTLRCLITEKQVGLRDKTTKYYAPNSENQLYFP